MPSNQLRAVVRRRKKCSLPNAANAQMLSPHPPLTQTEPVPRYGPFTRFPCDITSPNASPSSYQKEKCALFVLHVNHFEHHSCHTTHEALCPRTVPTLPTRPLVLRTLVLPSVLRLLGDERFPTLKVPTPLPLFAEGVFGGLLGLVMPASSSPDAGRFSPSLVSEGASHLVVVVVVVVHDTALRLAALRLTGD